MPGVPPVVCIWSDVKLPVPRRFQCAPMFKRIQMFKKGVTRPQGVGRGKAAILAGKGAWFMMS